MRMPRVVLVLGLIATGFAAKAEDAREVRNKIVNDALLIQDLVTLQNENPILFSGPKASIMSMVAVGFTVDQISFKRNEGQFAGQVCIISVTMKSPKTESIQYRFRFADKNNDRYANSDAYMESMGKCFGATSLPAE